ncbi:hypothetical protein V6N13_086979 [Hibiscus sabdariffa]
MITVLAEMKESDVKPNVVTFGILINQLCKLGSVDVAMELFDKIGKESGSPEEGLQLMERMKSRTDNFVKAIYLFDQMLRSECSAYVTVYHN